MLWTPFLLAAHATVLMARAGGSQVPADGFSAPYRIAMAFGTAFYAFLSLVLAFRVARNYVGARWAFLATLSIWWASSLPVYMYFNPSWSHAHSAFAVALFLWYWHETCQQRSAWQWCVLGAIAGLMLNVYYANAMLLAVLIVEAVRQYSVAAGAVASEEIAVRAPHAVQLLARHALFVAVLVLCLLPTFVTRHIIYGSAWESGYLPLREWAWRSPFFLAVLFSSNHGLFVWTPILLLAVAGLFFFVQRQPHIGPPILAAVIAFYLLIAAYPDWAGISSFGNRFFVSLTAPFILGLSVLLDRTARPFRSPRPALAAALSVLACFVLWNLAFLFQWGTHLIPPRGPISWSTMVHNQFFVVPREISSKLQTYLFHRASLMRQIEQRDIEQQQQQDAR